MRIRACQRTTTPKFTFPQTEANDHHQTNFLMVTCGQLLLAFRPEANIITHTYMYIYIHQWKNVMKIMCHILKEIYRTFQTTNSALPSFHSNLCNQTKSIFYYQLLILIGSKVTGFPIKPSYCIFFFCTSLCPSANFSGS